MEDGRISTSSHWSRLCKIVGSPATWRWEVEESIRALVGGSLHLCGHSCWSICTICSPFKFGLSLITHMHYVSFASQIKMANSKVILLRNATQPPTLQELWIENPITFGILFAWCILLWESGLISLRFQVNITLPTITWSAFVSPFKIQHLKIQPKSIDIVTPSSFHFLVPKHVPLKI